MLRSIIGCCKVVREIVEVGSTLLCSLFRLGVCLKGGLGRGLRILFAGYGSLWWN